METLAIRLHSYAPWLNRLLLANAVAVGLAVLSFMTMFGVLTESILAGLAFPVALVSMALEGDEWGIWMLSPLYLLPLHLLARHAGASRHA